MQILGFCGGAFFGTDADAAVAADDDAAVKELPPSAKTAYGGRGHVRSTFTVGATSNFRVVMYMETARCVRTVAPRSTNRSPEMFHALARCRRYKRKGLGFGLLLLLLLPLLLDWFWFWFCC